MSLEIRVGGGSLDLLPNAEQGFYITKQVHDLHDLETREGDFTKTITIPYSDHNILLLVEDIPSFTRHQNRGTRFISCEILLKGLPAVDDAVMRIESGDDDGFKASFFSGTVKFFLQLSDDGVNELFGSTDSILWTVANLATRVNSTYPTDEWVYARCGWLQNDSVDDYIVNTQGDPVVDGLNDLRLAESGFWLYTGAILDRIFAKLEGLTVDRSVLDGNNDFFRHAVACPMDQLHTNFNTGDGYSGTAGEILENLTTPQTNLTFPLAVLASENITLVNSQWVVGTGFDGVANLNTSGDYLWNFIGPVKRGTLSLMHNNAVVRNITLRYQQNSTAFNHDNSVPAVAGDVFWLRLNISGGVGVVMFNVGAVLAISKAGSTNTTVRISDWAPKISQLAFVRGFLNMFGLVAKEKAGVVKLEYLDRVIESASFTKDLDLGRPISESGIFAGYSRTNIVKYTSHPEIARTDTSAEFIVDVASEEEEQDKIVIPFIPTDNFTVGTGGLPVTIARYKLEKESKNFTIAWVGVVYTTAENNGMKVGDIIRIGATSARVTRVTNNTSGVTDATLGGSSNWYFLRWTPNGVGELHCAHMIFSVGSVVIRDGNNSQSVSTGHRGAFFPSQLGWSYMLNTYYKNFVNSVRSPYTLLAYFSINVLEFISIDQLSPIYVPSLGATFYINKIEQYNGKDLVRLELLQVGASNDIPSNFLDLQGAYDSAFSNDFNNFPEDTPSN